ncbi:MAG TPA: O-antigen ligase family protein [Candidatus Paceibacterota bacterium]|nr:O-antigen ligase family protein [Candidatus Paceibacterota bacterium]
MSADAKASQISNGMKYLDRAYPWILLSPVILPVVVWGGLIYPYLVPKTLFFYAISLTALGSFALLATHGRAFFWSRLAHLEAGIPAALLILAYVASYFGIDFYRSFWSLFVRGDGLLMLTSAVTSFYLILLYADQIFFERLLRLIAIVGSFVAVYGIGEWLMGGGRIGSLLGNAAFFAGYLGIAFFATVAAARLLPRAWRRLAYGGAVLQVIAITLSATRGTMLALGVAGIAMLIYGALKGKRTYRVSAISTLLLLVIFGGLFVAFRSELAHAPFAPIARVASIGTHDPDIASRLFIWKNMVGQIEQHLWLGVGAEHIDVLFNNFYDPTQIQEQWFDRSHNAFFDYAAQYGIGGLLLYLALIATFFTAAWRLAHGPLRRVASLFALLALVYAVQNFFVFDTISSFWLLLALLAALLGLSYEKDSRSIVSLPSFARPVSWGVALIAVGLILPVTITPAQAAYDLSHAYMFQLISVAKETQYLTGGSALHTYGDLEYGYQAYDMYVNNQASVLTGSARVEAYQVALTLLTQNFNQYPYDARTALYLASVLTLPPPGITLDTTLLASALTRAIQESPKRSESWYMLANLSISQANAYPQGSSGRHAGYTAALDILNRYIALVPNLAEPHFVLAQLENATGDTEAASREAALGKKYYVSDLKTALRAAGYYESVSDWNDSLFFLTEIVRLNPSDMTSRYDLAKVTYLTGDKAGAERIVAALRTADPQILETDQNFLSAITTYESR